MSEGDDQKAWRISVDTGGTFTDVVIGDAAGRFTIGKALTTQDRIFVGLRAALIAAAEPLGLTLASLLTRTDIFIYGTTRATNAIVTGNIAKTAFLTTAGFPDVLLLREGGKFNPHDFSLPYPRPYLPRRHTFEIAERVNCRGEVLSPLDEAGAVTTLETIRAGGFEACAVALLWSIANPTHEQRLGALLDDILPGVPYTLSHALNPILREYRRASSTAIDASIKPLMQAHLRDLQTDLREAGYRGELLVSTTMGGCLDIDSMIERPIHTVRSGPAMAPVAGRRYAEFDDQRESVLVVDTGGTTFDVSLIRDGRIAITQETWLGERFTGHMLGIPAVDARSVGAGGGSIAWLDSAGLLRVGPQSAGSRPGPACYGLGGQLPTVTDAAVVLGYIDPDYFLGGRMQLDLDAALAAINTIAVPLKLTAEAAAYSIFVVSNETMINAIKDITVSEGLDPSEAVVVAGGGAAGLGIVPIARELKCRGVIVPRTASALSACGMQFSDIQMEQSASVFTQSFDFNRALVNQALDGIDAALEPFAARMAARGFHDRRTEYRVDAHYTAQVWDISIELPTPRMAGDADIEKLVDAFHASHRRIFSVDDPSSSIEFLNWTGRLSLALPQSRASATKRADLAPTTTSRSACFDLDERRVALIYRGTDIRVGNTITGPAIIEEETTTVVIPPGARAVLTAADNYYIQFDGDFER